MARDKRGNPPEPPVDEVLNELVQEEGGDDFIAGPTQRNDVGNTKRAAAKATGVMGATKKLDPDLDIDHVDDGRIASGSKAGIRSFKEVPEEEDDDASFTLSNEEIAEGVPTTANKSPAARAAQTDAGTGSTGMSGGATSRKRVPAPGNAVDVPKGTLVRGHPTASQSGGKSLSSTGDEKPPKRAGRAAEGQVDRPLSKGGSEER
ncbi:hypothetical protein [Microvirga guangxiensis]|uniref:Uncharacterized protein n=1 Tax=Microvirga guangxiensis TaxID=549386 RepID=A0A1G5EJY2_9HYPH|nr:hypothetical protein [Microvirga guangxiensis]SCY27264.1 hypothetical protein SAMN02927923_01018 [Microvirga guangxiensis]